jgi:hypothetical protein
MRSEKEIIEKLKELEGRDGFSSEVKVLRWILGEYTMPPFHDG